MARRCDECGKGAMSGHNVSHSKRRTKRRFFPNLQSAKVTVRGVESRMRLCTRCLRTMKKRGAIVDRRKIVETPVDAITPAVAATV